MEQAVLFGNYWHPKIAAELNYSHITLVSPTRTHVHPHQPSD
jgi:hypothetical protein